MALRITILREQLQEVRAVARAQRLRVLKGLAFQHAGEDSAHLFFSRPPYMPGGAAQPCAFVVPSPLGHELQPADALRLAAESGLPERALVVVLDRVHDDRCRVFDAAGEPQDVSVIAASAVVGRRHQALLETGALAGRHVAVIGVGSFGATAAVELAKAGVGRFTLVDPDRLEPANICRHHCGVADLGRYKTHAVTDAIRQKNPAAHVEAHEVDVNHHLPLLNQLAKTADLLLCLTDGNRSRFNCNTAAIAAGRPAIFARAITRAAGGDVFVYRPGGPCLACLFSQELNIGDEEVSNARQAETAAPAYARAGAQATVQPGLAADIAPIVHMAVKLALTELAAPLHDPLWQRLADDLEAPFYVWANRRELVYEGWQPMKFSFNRNSILRWYGVRVPRAPGCLSCGLS